jgi:hypothetical protein
MLISDTGKGVLFIPETDLEDEWISSNTYGQILDERNKLVYGLLFDYSLANQAREECINLSFTLSGCHTAFINNY